GCASRNRRARSRMAAVARRATWSGLLASTRSSTRRENIPVDRLGREPATCPTDYPELGRFGKLSFGPWSMEGAAAPPRRRYPASSASSSRDQVVRPRQRTQDQGLRTNRHMDEGGAELLQDLAAGIVVEQVLEFVGSLGTDGQAAGKVSRELR